MFLAGKAKPAIHTVIKRRNHYSTTSATFATDTDHINKLFDFIATKAQDGKWT